MSSSLPKLKVSENKRFLVQENGEPFFWLGDTAWEMFHKLTREEAGQYLSNIYCPNGLFVKVAMGHIAGTQVKASWYDPRTGQFTEMGRFDNTGIQTFSSSRGRGNDWVLVLDAA